MLTVTLLGTGSPLPDPHRAGPATLITCEAGRYLVDAGRGVLMRLAEAGLMATQLDAVFLTHLHSDHFTDLNDIITTRWVLSTTALPLTLVGPPGTRKVVDHLLSSLAPDINYRLAHHGDLHEPPRVNVIEISEGPVPLPGEVAIRCAPTDHKPVEPSIGFRFDYGGASVVAAGDTIPCAGLDDLCRRAGALVHTVIRKDVIERIPSQRLRDTMDYHSSPAEAAQTAENNGVATLILTHYVPAMRPGGEEEWRALAAAHFSGRIELGDDLLRVEVKP